MSEIVRFDSGDGEVLVEVEERAGIRRAAKGDKGVVKAAESLDEAVDKVLPAAKRLLGQLEVLKPTSAELEFGIKLSGELGGFLAKAAGEGHFNVTLKWESEPDAPEPKGAEPSAS